MDQALTGKTALVTGAGSGLGQATALRLAAEGARVVVTELPHLMERAEATAEQLHDAHEVDAHALPLDVTDMSSIADCVSAAQDFGHGRIDILVNNAGIQYRKPMVDLATEDWRRVIDTNLTSAFVVGREAARRMIARGHGKIINIGSLTSELARATITPYTVAKGGIKMLTRGMAAEWGAHNIQANAIGPGYMLTDMNEALVNDPAFDAWVKGRTPARRWGRPEELVGAAVFLGSAASDYVNGQIIYVDGGMISVL